MQLGNVTNEGFLDVKLEINIVCYKICHGHASNIASPDAFIYRFLFSKIEATTDNYFYDFTWKLMLNFRENLLPTITNF
ncbi:hypothetical protein QE152_g26808 [Popillia japonica]|uniref:Uncharacterized protein n=1 Tax=Popillia japonica TaxID=7064 RepID=A0AAW1JXG6_POPJA